MKVFGCPAELPAPEPDYRNYDPTKIQVAEDEHKDKLKQWLVAAGFTGKYTGEIYSTPRADGYANYMFGDKGNGGVLVHLPYGDGWDDPDVRYIPKKEIIRRIDSSKCLNKLFQQGAK